MNEDGVRAALDQHRAQIIDALRSSAPRTAEDALWALRAMHEAMPLDALLRSPSEVLRQEGIERFGYPAEAPALPLVIDIARRDPIQNLRTGALDVLARSTQVPDVVKLFGEILDGTDGPLAIAATTAIERSKAVALAPQLRQVIVQRAEVDRKVAAIRALAELRDAESVSVLAARLNEAQPVRGEVGLALNTLLNASRNIDEWETWAQQQGYLH